MFWNWALGALKHNTLNTDNDTADALPQIMPKRNTLALALKLTNPISENFDNTLLFVTETNAKLAHFAVFFSEFIQNIKRTKLTQFVMVQNESPSLYYEFAITVMYFNHFWMRFVLGIFY